MANDGNNSSIEMITSAIGMATESFSGLNTALKVIKSIKDIAKDKNAGMNGEAREKLIDLTEQLLTVREQNAALREALLDMKETIRQREDFEAEAADYLIQEVAPNAFAYVAKHPASAEAPVVHFCANCFGNKKKSILQFSRSDLTSDVLVCGHCATETHVSVDRGPMVMTTSRDERGLW